MWTFDNKQTHCYSSGVYYLVKSDEITIQARYRPTKFTKGRAVTKAVAIGGPLLKNNTLIIDSKDATWNGEPILKGLPSSFDHSGVHMEYNIQYNNQGTLSDRSMNKSKIRKSVHVKIPDGTPDGLNITFQRWTGQKHNYIDWKIMMHPHPGQDGHCGNFNGDKADDVGGQSVPGLDDLFGWTVAAPTSTMITTSTGDHLSGRMPPVIASTTTKPTTFPKTERDDSDCPNKKRSEAERACKYLPGKYKKTCIIEMCSTAENSDK